MPSWALPWAAAISRLFSHQFRQYCCQAIKSSSCVASSMQLGVLAEP